MEKEEQTESIKEKIKMNEEIFNKLEEERRRKKEEELKRLEEAKKVVEEEIKRRRELKEENGEEVKDTKVKDVFDELQAYEIRIINAEVEIPENIPTMEILDPDDYADLAFHLDIENVFLTFKYEDKEKYLIRDEFVVYKYGEEIYNLIKPSLEEYNRKLEENYLNIPIEMKIVFIEENVAYTYGWKNSWMVDYEIGSPITVVDNMVKDSSKVKEVQDKNKEEIEQLKLELQEIIINDPDFKGCSNKRLRNQYKQLLERKDCFEKYRKCFINPTGYFSMNELEYFIELTWKALKEKMRIESIQIRPPFIK